MSVSLPAAPPKLPALSRAVAVGTALALVAVYVTAWQTVSLRNANLAVLGAVLGFVLFRAAYGFTGPWRVFVADRRGHGIRVHMAMLAIAAAVLIPLFAYDDLLGLSLNPAIRPLSLSVVIGAFLFGFGMQLGGGCGSGTLYVAGGGSGRTMITLVFFIVGSVLGSIHAPWWIGEMPALPPVALGTAFGPVGGVAATLLLCAGIALGVTAVERRRHGRLIPPPPLPAEPTGLARIVAGKWSFLAGGLVLAGLAVVVVLMSGQTWGITFGFTLWGAKAATALGLDLASMTFPGDDRAFWAAGWAQAALRESVLVNTTSVMAIGTLLGAAFASGIGGSWKPSFRLSGRSLAGAVLGGLLLGYGARLAFGCNIGALFGGIISGSLHGWLWMAAAFVGTILGVKARPFFDLPVERLTERPAGG